MLDHDLDRRSRKRVIYRLCGVLIDDPGSRRRTAGIEQLEVDIGLERRLKNGEPAGQLRGIDAAGARHGAESLDDEATGNEARMRFRPLRRTYIGETQAYSSREPQEGTGAIRFHIQILGRLKRVTMSLVLASLDRAIRHGQRAIPGERPRQSRLRTCRCSPAREYWWSHRQACKPRLSGSASHSASDTTGTAPSATAAARSGNVARDTSCPSPGIQPAQIAPRFGAQATKPMGIDSINGNCAAGTLPSAASAATPLGWPFCASGMASSTAGRLAAGTPRIQRRHAAGAPRWITGR